jgi:hypothetical protein
MRPGANEVSGLRMSAIPAVLQVAMACAVRDDKNTKTDKETAREREDESAGVAPPWRTD